MANGIEKEVEASKSSAVLDNIEKLLKIGKEIAVIVAVSLLCFKLLPLVSIWMEQLSKSKVAGFELLGVKLAFEQEKLQVVAGGGQPQKTANDRPVSALATAQVERVQAIQSQIAVAEPSTTLPSPTPEIPKPSPQSTSSRQSFWVYLGVSSSTRLPSKNFQIESLPVPGQIIVASTEVYKRTGPPEAKGEEWFLSDTKGVLRSKQSVRVLRLEKIDSTAPGAFVVWAEVEPK